jgi:hypothetical protein
MFTDAWLTMAMLVSYSLVVAPWVPGIGFIGMADCMFVQAFGRGSFTDAELFSKLMLHQANGMFNDLETFRSLHKQGFKVGKSNIALARFAMRIYDQLGIVIISQWEVVYALWELDEAWYIEHVDDIDCLWPPSDYFATWHVKLESKERMLRRGLSRPLEVAHPAMLARAILTIWRTGVRPIVLGVSLFFWRHELWVWDEESIQPWTRNFKAWLSNTRGEVLARPVMTFMHLYKMQEIMKATFEWSRLPNGIREKLASIHKQLPGDWIRFTPPPIEDEAA